LAAIALTAALAVSGCSRGNHYEERRDDNTAGDKAAREVGRGAYHLGRVTEKAARKAGEAIREATHEAHQGWKEAKQEDKAKRTRY
jgi:hypothetical protein